VTKRPATGKSNLYHVVSLTGLLGLVRLAGLIQQQMIAYYFGTSAIGDAFNLALTVPSILVTLLGVPLSNALMPFFSSCQAAGRKQEGWDLWRASAAGITFISAIISVVGFAASGPLVELLGHGMDAETQRIAVSMSRAVFATLSMLVAAQLMKVPLNANQDFLTPAYALLAQNVVTNIVLLWTPEIGSSSLSTGFFVGAVALFGLQWWALLRRNIWEPGSWRGPASGMRQVVLITLPLVLSGALSYGPTVLERYLASGLPVGSIAALTYADKVRQLPVGLFALALSTVLYPQLTRHSAQKDAAALSRTAVRGFRLILFVTLPIVAGAMVEAFTIVRILFERGAFSAVSTTTTAGALLFYLPGILGLSVSGFVGYVFYALRDTLTPLYTLTFASIAYVVSAYPLSRLFGLPGLALANTMSVSVAGGLMVWTLARRVPEFRVLLRTVPIHLFSLGTVLYGGAAWAMARWVSSLPTGVRLHRDLLEMGLSTCAGLVVYLLVLYHFRLEEVSSFVKTAKFALQRATKPGE
jgi:putative peptidoglycan lipid II flippase